MALSLCGVSNHRAGNNGSGHDSFRSDPMDIESFQQVIAGCTAEELRALLRRRPDLVAAIHEHSFELNTPAIVVAARRGNLALVDALLEFGADVNSRSSFWSRTVGALDSCPEGLREDLVQRGALEEVTTFVDAVREGDADTVRRLFAATPRLAELVDHPLFPFGAPAVVKARNNRLLVDALLDAGADINAVNFHGFGTLDDTEPTMARYLIERGARVTIHAAAALGLADQLDRLIAADPQCIRDTGGDGQTALHVAADVAIIDLLLAHGADINARCEDHQSTPLQYQITNGTNARHLIARGAHVDLFAAAAMGDLEQIRDELQRCPASIHARTHQTGYDRVPVGTIYHWRLGFRKSPHQIAKERGHEKAYQLLMELSPPAEGFLNACLCGGQKPARDLAALNPGLVHGLAARDRARFIDAAWCGNLEAVRLMLELGFAVDEKIDDETAVGAACLFGHVEILKLLLCHGPDLSVRNEHGATPLGIVAWASLNFANADGDYGGCARELTAAGVPIEDWMFSESSSAVRAELHRHSISIRDLQSAEIGAISALAIRSKASWGYDAEMMRVFVDELTLTEKSFAGFLAAKIAVKDAIPVGYCSLVRRSHTQIELEHLFVDPKHFGQGIGTRLFHEACEIARRHGAQELTLIADPFASGFYERLGANETGRHQSPFPGRLIPIMSIRLQP